MYRNDFLFSAQLNYHLNVANPKDIEASASSEDITSINLRSCTFESFSNALLYERAQNPDYSFMDSSLDAVKPSDFNESKKYNFIDLTEYAKHTAIAIGNMTLFSELQKIASAIESFMANSASTNNSPSHVIRPFDDYNSFDIKSQPATMEELGSCVIGGGSEGAIKIAATFHESSTGEHPILSIRFYSLNNGVYLTNRDIIGIDNIYKANASLMEAFAYMSYRDYLNNHFNYSFDKLLISDSIEIDSLDDMYNKHYDLRIYDKLY